MLNFVFLCLNVFLPFSFLFIGFVGKKTRRLKKSVTRGEGGLVSAVGVAGGPETAEEQGQPLVSGRAGRHPPVTGPASTANTVGAGFKDGADSVPEAAGASYPV